MNIFVTGATGFLGSHLVESLAPMATSLRCLVRKSSDHLTLQRHNVEVVTGDIRDQDSLRMGMRGCDVVIHTAAASSFWEPRNQSYREINVAGTENVMRCALEARVSKVVHISTLAVYGNSPDSPLVETSSVGPQRFSEYARTKHAGDCIAWDLHKAQGLPLITLYLGGLIGPGDTKGIGELIDNILNGRLTATVFDHSIFPWVALRDVIEAIKTVLGAEDKIGEKYFLCSENRTFSEINQLISQISGIPLPGVRIPNQIMIGIAACMTLTAKITRKRPLCSLDQARTMAFPYRVDGSKAERTLGISYTPIRVALEEAVAWHRERNLQQKKE